MFWFPGVFVAFGIARMCKKYWLVYIDKNNTAELGLVSEGIKHH